MRRRDRMMWLSHGTRFSRHSKAAYGALAIIFVQMSSFAHAEEPSAAAIRFYQEYMGSGVALKPLGDRWFTERFRGVMNAWDSDPLQKPREGNPILPWKDWDIAWRHKLKAEVLQASWAQAVVLVAFANDENGRSIARLVRLEKVGNAWRVDDVTDPPR